MRADNELISMSLNFWANYIETGDITLSRNDCVNREEYKKILPLTDDQVAFVLRLRKLSKDYLLKALK